MKSLRTVVAALCAAALLAASPALVAAAEPERVAPSFEVAIGPGPSVEMSFALALSEVTNYPVTITAISGEVEEQLFNGSIEGGIYRFSAPLTKIKAGPVKIVMRTRVTNRSDAGNTNFLSYQKWEGTIR